jgi:hypothetical protein
VSILILFCRLNSRTNFPLFNFNQLFIEKLQKRQIWHAARNIKKRGMAEIQRAGKQIKDQPNYPRKIRS